MAGIMQVRSCLINVTVNVEIISWLYSELYSTRIDSVTPPNKQKKNVFSCWQFCKNCYKCVDVFDSIQCIQRFHTDSEMLK